LKDFSFLNKECKKTKLGIFNIAFSSLGF